MNFGQIFLSEFLGTGALLLLGCGVVANAVLAKNKGFGGGFLMINIGWCFAVMVGIVVGAKSGAHLNPAVTIGFLAAGNPGNLTFTQVMAYFAGQFAGAFTGAVLCWAAYRDHFDDPESEAGAKLAVFSTGPAIRDPAWNLVTEIIGTFVLVFSIFALGQHSNASGGLAMTSADVGKVVTAPGGFGFLIVPFVVLVIGTSLGGPTGYAINPARDLAPRVAHFVLPIKGKGDSDWGYAWVPVLGPIIGAVLAGLVANAVNFV